MRHWHRYAALAATLLAVALGAHWALEQTAVEHAHAAHGALAVCVLLFALFGGVRMLAPPSPHRRRVGHSERRGLLGPVFAQPCIVNARASPAWLQRFQN